MLELFAVAVTVGALLHQVFGFSIHQVLVVSLAAAMAAALLSSRWLAIAGTACVLGALLIWHENQPVPERVFGTRTFSGTVISVERELTGGRMVVRDRETGMRVLLWSGADVLPGDSVGVSGDVSQPEPFETDTGRMFSYDRYLASKGIAGIVQSATVSLQQEGDVSLARLGTIIRFSIADAYARYVSFPFDGVIAGMTVGYQGGIPLAVQELFRHTGVLHVLVLSGYNVTLVAGMLGMLLRRFPVRLRIAATMLFIILLVVVSGSGVAGVRAGIMGGIALIADASLRTYQPLRALCIAYLFFFFSSPLAVFFDPGLHLSFLATGFMVLFLPVLVLRLEWLPQWMREPLALAGVLPLFMLPYTMYFLGLFPVATIPANIVLSFAVPVCMVLAFLLLAVSWLPPLASLLGIVLSGVGNLLLGILKALATLPVWQTPPVSGLVVLFGYVCLIVLVVRRRSLPRQSCVPPASSSFEP